MAVASFDGQFSFKQDSLARLGSRSDIPKMSAEQRSQFQNSPFMQGVRKTEELCWKFTCSRDEKRAKIDPSFKPQDSDFDAPKAHGYDKAINYYRVLGIDDYATLEEVKKSYKKLSLVYHPDKTTGLSDEQKEEYAGIFIELKNAYLTLGDNPTRRQYDRDRDRDKAGEEINGFKPKKRAQFDATEVLKKLQEMQRPPGKTINVQIQARLEKFFYGGHKAVKRDRKVKRLHGFESEAKIYRIDIKQGVTEPCECVFRRQGDMHEETQPDSVRFELKSKPHESVVRKGGDLALKAKVGLGVIHAEPFFSTETPSVRGRHLLLWGRNPFFRTAGPGTGDLHVKIHGEGMGPSGCLRFTCRCGTAVAKSSTAPTADVVGGGKPAFHSSDEVIILVKHMQTEAVRHLVLKKGATLGDVRVKLLHMLGLPRGATVRLLQQCQGGFTPYPDKQPLGDLRSLNCAGTPWYGVTLTVEKSKQLLQKMISISDTDGFKARAAAGDPSVMDAFLGVLPEYGLEPSLKTLLERSAAAMKMVEKLPDGAYYRQKLDALRASASPPKPAPATAAAAPARTKGGPASGREGLKRFVQRFGLGPPGGFTGPGSDTEEEQGQGRGGGGEHGVGGLCEAPSMKRRIAQRLKQELACEVELAPVGEPLTLFTRPTCSIVFYSNAHQLQHGSAATSAAALPAPPVFAVSVSSPPCAKKVAATDWMLLKGRLLPLLQLTAFHFLPAARSILPLSITRAPSAPGPAGPDPSTILVPWKRLGNEAFKRGDYFTAMALYSRCLEALPPSGEGGPDEEAVALSNRAACLIRVKHYGAAVIDAQRALELRPRWGRAWERLGLAMTCLRDVGEAANACFKAAEFEPSEANAEALLKAEVKASVPNVDAAHSEKEKGNEALRVKEFGLATACYTRALAHVPPLDTARVQQGGDDEHAMLRSVLHSNRAAAYCQLRRWRLAVADGEKAVSSKEDFAKAHNRLGVALLGCGETERAYAEFAMAMRLDPTDNGSLKGRNTCTAMLPLWRSIPARRRLRDRFGIDLTRPKGSSKVYCISDMHFDHRCNEDWAHRIDDFKFQEDVLVVAGNLCDTKNAIVRALATLKAKFRRVFYVPGNHELWLSPSEAPKMADSLAKFLSILEVCDEMGVDVFPAAVTQDVFVVPLFSWYHAEFDHRDPFPDPAANFDPLCRWPLDPETQLWKYMLKLNEAHLQRPYHGTVVTVSHFVPLQTLPHLLVHKAAKATGCEDIDAQVRSINAKKRVHVYGHSPRSHTAQHEGVLYVNHYHGDEGGREDRAPILLIHDGREVVQRPVDIYDGPVKV